MPARAPAPSRGLLACPPSDPADIQQKHVFVSLHQAQASAISARRRCIEVDGLVTQHSPQIQFSRRCLTTCNCCNIKPATTNMYEGNAPTPSASSKTELQVEHVESMNLTTESGDHNTTTFYGTETHPSRTLALRPFRSHGEYFEL